MIPFEGLHRFLEGVGDGLERGLFFGCEVVGVLVEGRAGVDLVLDAVESGQEYGRECEVGVGGGVRWAELDALGFGVVGVDGDATGGGAVTGGVDEVDGGFVAGDEALVGVGCGGAEGHEGIGVLEQAADVVAGGFTDEGIIVIGVVEDVGAVLPQG